MNPMWFSFFGHRPRRAAAGELNTDDCTLAKQGAAYTVELDRHVITTTNLPQWDKLILAGLSGQTLPLCHVVPWGQVSLH